jgi:hypothetical protein
MSCKIKLILQCGAIIIRCNCFIWSCGFCSFKDFVFDDCCFLIGRRIFLFNNAHVYPVHAVDGVEVNDKKFLRNYQGTSNEVGFVILQNKGSANSYIIDEHILSKLNFNTSS